MCCRLPPLLKTLTELQCKVHNPPTYKAENHPGPMDIIVTSGSQDGLCKVRSFVMEGLTGCYSNYINYYLIVVQYVHSQLCLTWILCEQRIYIKFLNFHLKIHRLSFTYFQKYFQIKFKWIFIDFVIARIHKVISNTLSYL